MAGRWDVDAEGVIHIMKPEENREHHHLKFAGGQLSMALLVIERMLKEDLSRAAEERFKPLINREAKKAYRELEAKNPHGSQSK